MANEALKQLVRHALTRRDEFFTKREQLSTMEKQCQLLREEMNEASQAFRTAIGVVMEEARHRYKNDRLIELDGNYCLLRVNMPHTTEDSIVILEPDVVKEKEHGKCAYASGN